MKRRSTRRRTYTRKPRKQKSWLDTRIGLHPTFIIRRLKARSRKKKVNKGLEAETSLNPFTNLKNYRYQRDLKRAHAMGAKHLSDYIKMTHNKSELITLARYARKSPTIAKHLFKNPNAPDASLQAVVKSKNKKVLMAVLDCKEINPKYFKYLAKGETRVKALAHSSCPPEMLKIGFFDDIDARLAILNNPNTTAENLAKADLSNVHEALALAKNPSTPQNVLEKLAKKYSKNKFYLSQLAKNKNIPRGLVYDLAKEANKPILTKLLTWVKEKDILNMFRNTRDINIQLALAVNPNLDEKMQDRLVKLNVPAIDHALASNPNLTPKNQVILAETEDEFSKERNEVLAENENLSNDLMWLRDIKPVSENIPNRLHEIHKIKSEEIRVPDFTFGLCSVCGRPISGKWGDKGDKCRRKK